MKMLVILVHGAISYSAFYFYTYIFPCETCQMFAL